MPLIPGLDVSEFQGAIDWPRVRAAGRQFAFIRATDGTYHDPRFAANWAGAKAAGIVRGAYHFAEPANPPEAEADSLLAAVGNLEAGDLLALDLEKGAGDLRAWTAAFHARIIARVGFRALHYSSPAFLAEHGPITDPANCGLWLANWRATLPAPPPGWPFIAVWQNRDDDSVPGINGHVDGDYFDGPDIAHLLAYGAPGAVTPGPPVHAPPPPPPVPPPSPLGAYVVRAGDTMSAIAAAHHVSLLTLEAANPRAGHPPGNFNLIDPGDLIFLPASGLPVPAPAPTGRTYVVRGGDSLSGIARRLGVMLLALEQLNPGLRRPPHDWSLLYPGDVVHLP